MTALVLVALAGFVAQLVDGSLGMAFGVTATTGLLAVGTAPAIASASVHLAEIGTAVASGASHWKLGNIDWPVVGWLAVPGAVGGFAGATVLASLSTEAAAPWMALLLTTLGVYVLLRFSLLKRPVALRPITPRGRRWLVPLGAAAGFVDATGGGGWGPISTSTLLSTGRLSPRRTIGSVDTSEVLVALATSGGFLLTLGSQALSPTVVGGLLIGGMLAAPLAAWLVRIMPTRVIGVGAGGMIVLTNGRVLLNGFEVASSVQVGVYAVLIAAWIAAMTWATRETLAERKAARAAAPDPTAPAEVPVA